MTPVQHPRLTAAEQAMLQSYDHFLTVMERNPRAAAALALQTLNLWSSAAQPQQKATQHHEQLVSRPNDPRH